ncbi:TPA: hypothetical protein ACOVJB_005710 [Klebsiella oxytoca]
MEIQTERRISKMVLVTTFGGVRAAHFCLLDKLSGNDSDLWFPLADGMELFEALETILYINHVAVNVTSLELLRKNGQC